MKRILVSQNENNNGADYLIVNGTVLTDEDSMIESSRRIAKTDNWEEIYKDEFLEIRKKDSQLLLKSFYKDKDVAGRAIYYLYLVQEKDDLKNILNYLEKDSLLINRTIDRVKTLELIDKIQNNGAIKKKLIKYLILILGISFLVYLITK